MWVDTCCTNKESSAELSEAINSMYRWYEAAATCYAYLSDVDCNAASNNVVEYQFQQSLWFTRGWTLQELLAPDHVIFYDFNWTFLGTKHTLSDIIEQQTGINKLTLRGKSIADYSIAQRMSWASRRVATRAEDVAYYLLRIFDVNMPMLYSEGTKVFIRLQERIIKQSNNHSIFAWSIDEREQTGLLTDSPAAFATCQNVEGFGLRTNHSAYAMTTRGLSCTFIVVPFIVDTYLVRLIERMCTTSLWLSLCAGSVRTINTPVFGAMTKALMSAKAETWDNMQINVNVRQKHAQSWDRTDHVLLNGFRISPFGFPINLRFKVHGCEWNPRGRELSFKPGKYYQIGVLDFSPHGGKLTCLKLGFDIAYNPVCLVLPNKVVPGGIDGTPSNPALSDMGSKQAKSFWERTPFDDLDCSRCEAGEYAYDLEGLPGLWALKGDRLDGSKAWLTSDSIEAFRGLNGVFIQVLRKEVHRGSVWDVRWNYSNVHKPEYRGMRHPQEPQAHYTNK